MSFPTSTADAAIAASPSRPAAPRTAEPPRFDVYVGIHKALRHLMTDTLVRVGRIDVADRADRDEALAQLELLLDVCLGHLRHENEHVHTAIEARQPAGSRRIAGEHAEHVEAIDELRAEAAALRDAGHGADADRVALRLYRHLALFVADNFQHMHIEETAHNALLWQHYSDRELVELHGRILAAIAPEEHAIVARWMVPASTPVERTHVVGGAKAQMPAPAFRALMRTVAPHVDAVGWTKLAHALDIDPALRGA